MRMVAVRGAVSASVSRPNNPSKQKLVHYAARLLMSDSAGMPTPTRNRQIILSVSGRLRLAERSQNTQSFQDMNRWSAGVGDGRDT